MVSYAHEAYWHGCYRMKCPSVPASRAGPTLPIVDRLHPRLVVARGAPLMIDSLVRIRNLGLWRRP